MCNEERIEGRKEWEGWGIEIDQDMAGEERRKGLGVESRVTGKWDVRATGDQLS